MEFLIFIAAVVALILIWRKIAGFYIRKGHKSGVSHFAGAACGILAFLFVLVLMFELIRPGSYDSDKRMATDSPHQASNETRLNPSDHPDPKVPAKANEDRHPQQASLPVQPPSEKVQIKQIVANTLKGNNNMNKPYVRKIMVVKQIDGGWGVFTEYNAGDNLTSNLRIMGIKSKMSKIYAALYTSGKDIRTASVAAWFPLQDKYGNQSDGGVYKSILDKTEADKVNWQADKASLELDILPGVWTTTFIHPAMLN